MQFSAYNFGAVTLPFQFESATSGVCEIVSVLAIMHLRFNVIRLHCAHCINDIIIIIILIMMR